MPALYLRRACLTASLLLSVCAPSRDTVLKDVERNYTATGFLDTDTFQVRCALPLEESDRLALCNEKLLDALVAYKEKYDRDAFARRMHQDFLPFLKPADVTDATRLQWRVFFQHLAKNRTRLVFEQQNGDAFDGAYRLRLQDLIYRVQKPE